MQEFADSQKGITVLKGFKKERESCGVSVPADIYFLPWKSSVHKFISTIWQAVNGHNLAGMIPPSPHLSESSKKGGFFVYGMIDNKS